jgi:hypothetical protein
MDEPTGATILHEFKAFLLQYRSAQLCIARDVEGQPPSSRKAATMVIRHIEARYNLHPAAIPPVESGRQMVGVGRMD